MSRFCNGSQETGRGRRLVVAARLGAADFPPRVEVSATSGHRFHGTAPDQNAQYLHRGRLRPWPWGMMLCYGVKHVLFTRWPYRRRHLRFMVRLQSIFPRLLFGPCAGQGGRDDRGRCGSAGKDGGVRRRQLQRDSRIVGPHERVIHTVYYGDAKSLRFNVVPGEPHDAQRDELSTHAFTTRLPT